MPEDGAMDLNDEGVEAAARVLYDRVKSVPTLTYDIAYPSEQDDFRRVASAMLTAYLRAVPESDEQLAMQRATTVAEAAQEWQDANDAIGEADGGDPDISTMLHRRRIAVHVLRQALYVWKLNLLSPDEAAGDE